MDFVLGFLGFGEAAFHIASGLKKEGLDKLVAYDAKLADKQAGGAIRARAAGVGVAIAETLDEFCASAQCIASLTSAGVALVVAESVMPKLKAGQVYADMNAAGPAVKQKIAALPRAQGVLVCDAAVMSPVPGKGHKVPISLSGDGAAAFYETFSPFGMRLTRLDAPAGASSAIKMFRSVFMKGLPQLLIESMLPAAKFGALDEIAKSLTESISGKTIEQLANEFIPRTIIHAARRAHEMDEATQTLEEMGCDASMSRATGKKLEQEAQSGLGAKLPGDGAIDYREVLKLLAGI